MIERIFFIGYSHLVLAGKLCPAPKQVNASIVQVALDARASELVDNTLPKRGDLFEIKPQVVGIDSKISAALDGFVNMRGFEHGLGRHAGIVRAVPAELVTELFHDRDLHVRALGHKRG